MSRGRHRAPTNTAKHLARLTAGAAIAASPLALFPATAFAAEIPWGKIVECESSGNPRATNGTHFGLLQFDLPTWRSVGGAGNPMDASVEEQLARGRTLAERRGTQPWLASKRCWAGSTDTTPNVVGAPAPRAQATPPPPPTPTPSWKQAAGGYTVQRGDTLSGIAAPRQLSWQAVHEANREVIGPNPNMIHPGQQLDLGS